MVHGWMCRTLLLLLLFLIGFAWISILLMLFLGYRIKVRYYYLVRVFSIICRARRLFVV